MGVIRIRECPHGFSGYSSGRTRSVFDAFPFVVASSVARVTFRCFPYIIASKTESDRNDSEQNSVNFMLPGFTRNRKHADQQEPYFYYQSKKRKR